MYELKKDGKVLTSKSVGTGPSSYEKSKSVGTGPSSYEKSKSVGTGPSSYEKSKSVGTGPSSYEKRIYWAAVSQRLRNTALD